MEHGASDFLIQAVTYLGAAAVIVPLFNRFRLGSVLGYLAAGVAVGPFGFGLLRQEEEVFEVAELGVVLFLFVIGLELSLARLWAMRRDIFGLGLAQMAATGAVIAGVLVVARAMPAPAALVTGAALAFSSTALAMQMLRDRGERSARFGERSFAVLLFQDLAVVPLLIGIPFAAGAMPDVDQPGLIGLLRVVLVIGALILIARYGLSPVLRIVAASGSREAFAATALFIVTATALAVSWAGLSMALGAFLAGALLADSAYRHQIETDIEPFRGLLLGLFFISIGMRLDLSVVAAQWLLVLGGAVVLVALKAGLLYALARVVRASHAGALKMGALLAQAGEFAFVVFSLGRAEGLFTSEQETVLSSIVTVSMALTPLLLFAADRLAPQPAASIDDLERPPSEFDHVIVAGFGRVGQIIAQVLRNSGVKVTAIDRNPEHIRNAERFGFKVYYGDGGRFDTLFTAGALEARGVVLTMDDREAANRAVQALRAWSPTLPIFVVAHDRMHEISVRPLGPDVVVRETLESSLLMAREVLRKLNFPEALIDDYVAQFRETDRERLLAQMDYGPEARMDLIHRKFEARSEEQRAAPDAQEAAGGRRSAE
jgi:monovalent cation:proton antiporter-2 (CPA2) family protein